MSSFHHLISVATLGLAAFAASAQDVAAGPISIGHPHARATAAGQSIGGGFMSLENRGEADKLVGVRATVSNRVEMHTMRMEGDVMRMRQVEAIELPAGGKVELKPGGNHVMFIGLNAPLKAGESFPLVLRFEKAGEVTVQMRVEALAPAGADAADVHKH